MKRGLMLFVALLFGSSLFSAPVSVETAKKVAGNWFYEKGKLDGKGISIENYLTEYKGKEVVFYVFNIKPAGFVIVSADDIVPPVLGYSINGHYMATNHPPQMDEFLDCFKEQILYAKKNNITPYNYVAKEWSRLSVEDYKFVKLGGSKDVSPLLTTTWAQNNIYGGSPVIYNSLCPTISSTRCITGCVATTMGQIMNYHESPTTGVGSHSYTQGNLDNPTVSANFGATTYDWANMPNTLQGGSTTTQRNAVGTLLFHCGVAVDMQYGTSASSATNTAAASAFVNYFAYDNGLTMAYKSSYVDTVWARMMRTELDSSCPVFYWGTGTGGHAFVMDGYSGNYFHFNWGWEGDYNGNFLLTDLTPGSYNFTTNQGAIFKIKPAVPTPDISASPDTLRFAWNPPKKSILAPSSKGITDTLIYDSGTIGGIFGTSVNWGMATRFTPDIYPCTLKSIIWYPYKKDTACEAHVWDDDGNGGVPGTNLITAFTYTPGVTQVWEKKDLTSPIPIDAGDFWVGWIQKAGNIFGNGVTIPATVGRSFYYNGGWQVIDAGTFGATGELMIRAIVTSGNYDTTRTLIVSNPGSATLNVSNITGSEAWITSISPTSFNVNAKGTQNVTVIVTKDGLGYGYHNASLTITSNDPDENPKIVPVKFYVTPPAVPEIAVTEDTIRFVWDDSGKKSLCVPSKESYEELGCKVEGDKKTASLKIVENNNQPALTFSCLSSKATLDTLIFDDGTPDKGYYWGAGARMGARLSPTGACKIMAVQIFCSQAETYKVGLYNWTGGAPGSQLLETGNVSSTGQGWNTTDVSSSNINVTGDFVASFNMIDGTAALGVDSAGNGRAWDYNGTNWASWTETYFVRAIVSYGGGTHDTLTTMTVRNDGGADLHVSNITKGQSWITSVSPTSFTVAPASSQNVTVIVSRAGLGNGTHLGSLTIASDDADEASYVEPVRFLIMNVGVEENQKLPFSMSQNYPNPARSRAKIEYALPSATNVNLKIYDMTGRPIRTLVSGVQEAGQHTIAWDGGDDKGKEMASGVYFYRLETTASTVTKKLTLMR